jgi:hypothetical protein
LLKQISTYLTDEKYTHCLVCWSPREEQGGFTIHHICGYVKKPSVDMMESLINELRLDEEFNMTDMVFGKDYNVSLLEIGELATIEGMIVDGDSNVN